MTQEIQDKGPQSSTVGYGNPPRHTRFKKGASGNPQGRPKGTLNAATVLKRILCETVVIYENGQPRTVTKLEAVLTQLVNKALPGDLKALQLLMSLVRSAEEREMQAVEPTQTLRDTDKKVVQGILKRIEGARWEGGTDDSLP
jgi:hypothetical protein